VNFLFKRSRDICIYVGVSFSDSDPRRCLKLPAIFPLLPEILVLSLVADQLCLVSRVVFGWLLLSWEQALTCKPLNASKGLYFKRGVLPYGQGRNSCFLISIKMMPPHLLYLSKIRSKHHIKHTHHFSPPISPLLSLSLSSVSLRRQQ
jgi:hypothetical protein